MSLPVNIRRAAFIAIALLIAALLFITAQEYGGTEESGGAFTGPAIDAALIAALLATFAAALMAWKPRLAKPLAALSLALAAPLLLWRIAPGFICQFGTCSFELPMFDPDPQSVLILAGFVALLVLRGR